MKKLCTHILASGFVVLTLLAVLAMPQWGGAAMANESEDTFTKAELARMSTFLSNFTEVQLMNFTAAEVLNPKDPAKAIFFGIQHNYINNFRSRVVPCDLEKDGADCLAIDIKYVLESIEKYFGKSAQVARFVKGLQANQPKEFDGRFYHFRGADGDPPYHANVQSAERNPDGTISMRGVVYNPDRDDYLLGPFEAVARPQTYKGKGTWAIIRMSVPGRKWDKR